jgi:hypothetical protein
MSERSRILLLIITILTICKSRAFSTYVIKKSMIRGSHRLAPVLHAISNLDDDDDMPKLSMREENDGPAMSVKSFEDIKKGAVYSSPKVTSEAPMKVAKPSVSFGKGVFGSMSVEDLKSRGFVRESVQKVHPDLIIFINQSYHGKSIKR